MTVIAWDGKTLAADRRTTNAGLARTTRKIFMHGNELLAFTGCAFTSGEMRMWYEAGAKPEAFPAAARDGETTMAVISHQGIRVYCSGPAPMVIFDGHYALGSGRDYALAAMYLGKSAAEAVNVACQFDLDCGNGIDTLTLPPRK